MNREQLEHAIRAACDVSEDTELIVFGSQSILAEFPDAEAELTRSIEVDISPKNKPENVHRIDGALGENSLFHQTHGFYVHGVSLETAVLPQGWERRTNPVRDYMDRKKIGWCIEAHDLAASKLIAFREKDIVFVRRLLAGEMIGIEELNQRIKKIEAEKELVKRALNWVERMKKEIAQPGKTKKR